MILCLDVGNTQIYGGVFEGEKLKLNFRKNSKTGASSDELGLFLRGVLRENDVDPAEIQSIAVCTVVPDVVHSLRSACLKYFDIEPFVFQAGVKNGLKIKYRNPVEVGADRIANAVGAVQRYPGKNLVIVDFGTATTFDAVTADKEYLGGTIVAGLRISMEALEGKTAKLPTVEIVRPDSVVGRSTIEAIQAGLYYGNVGIIKELVRLITEESFGGKKPVVIGTGGFSRLFEKAGLFDAIIPDLVLNGLLYSLALNTEKSNSSRRSRSERAGRI